MRIAWFFLFFCSFALAQTSEIKINNDQGIQILVYKKSYALVIGMSKYTKGWGELPAVGEEVKKVKTALVENGFQVFSVMNAPANELRQKIAVFIKKFGSQPDNRILIYFAGHGYTYKSEYEDGSQGIGYIVPIDAPNPKAHLVGFLEKAIAMELFDIYAKQIKSDHALFIFDSCFSGSIFDTSAEKNSITERISYGTGLPTRQFIIAGQELERRSSENLFTDAFIKALQGRGDQNNDSYLTASELGAYLEKTISRQSQGAQNPQIGKLKSSLLNKGDFVFQLRLPKILSANEKEDKLRWYKKLAQMKNGYQKVIRYDKTSVSSIKKVKYWEKFLQVFREDNPYTQDDEKMCFVARQKIAELQKKPNIPTSSINQGSSKFVYLRTETYTCQNQKYTVKEYKHEQTGLEFILVPGGSYMRGSNIGKANESPIHKVNLQPFLISKYEVPQVVWEKIMGKQPSRYQNNMAPVENVSWTDAQDFCQKTGLTLPTEAQWEYACRAGSTGKFCFGNDEEMLVDYAHFGGWHGTQRVGEKKPNAFGLYDMHGNVWEWCQDYFGEYPTNEVSEPKGPKEATYRVCRGGSWNFLPDGCRCAFRDRLRESYRSQFVGLRVVKNIK